MRNNRSGILLVAVLVGIAAVFSWLTWNRYNRENPTSVDASMLKENGRWIVLAEFEPDAVGGLREGTRAVASSPDFPSLKMSGSIEEILPDHSVRIGLEFAPEMDAKPDRAPAKVTVDTATAPVD